MYPHTICLQIHKSNITVIVKTGETHGSRTALFDF